MVGFSQLSTLVQAPYQSCVVVGVFRLVQEGRQCEDEPFTSNFLKEHLCIFLETTYYQLF